MPSTPWATHPTGTQARHRLTTCRSRQGCGPQQGPTRRRERPPGRHQLIILQRQVKHPRLSNRDRLRLLLLASATPFWRQALLIVQPDTLLRWHRQLFRPALAPQVQTQDAASRITPETIALIRQMGTENGTWGAERIHGELLKLGVRVSKRTIQRYLPPKTAPATSPSNQNWGTLLGPRRSDFGLRPLTGVRPLLRSHLRLRRRRAVLPAHCAPRRDKSSHRCLGRQRLREATPWGEHPRFLIHDNDNGSGPHFEAVAGSGIGIIRTPCKTPDATHTWKGAFAPYGESVSTTCSSSTAPSV